MTLRGEVRTLDITYEPLKEGEIRLMTFKGLPRKSPDIHPKYHLQHVSIDDPPRYIALSYRWGNGKELDEPAQFKDHWLNIRGGALTAVWSYLSNSSTEDYQIPFWIDQFCIEQSNVREMSEQVSMMHDIYSKASKTIIYLGVPQGPESSWNYLSAFDYLRTLGDDCLASNSMDHLLEFTKKQRVGTIAALASILAAPWFSRTWVVQEAILSRNAVVLCGTNIEDMVKLCVAISRFDQMGFLRQLFRDFHTPEYPWQTRVQRVRLFYHLKLSFSGHRCVVSKCLPQDAIQQLLARCRPLEATDRRDKIFALAGICRAEDVPNLDYDLSAKDVYRNIAVRMLNERHHYQHRCDGSLEATKQLKSCPWNGLCLLALVNADHGEIASPSWIPDWSLPLTYNDLWFEHEESFGFYASGSKTPHIELPENSPHMVMIDGKLCFTVSSTGEESAQTRTFHESDMDDCDFAKEWWAVSRGRMEGNVEQDRRLPEWIMRAGEYLRIHSGIGEDPQSREQRIVMTLCAGASVETASGRGGDIVAATKRGQLAALWKSSQEFTARRLAVPGNSKDDRREDRIDAGSGAGEDMSCAKLLGMIGIACRGRRLFVTEDGHIGLGPGRMREGDVISVLYGSHWPFVLRPHGEGFHLVGYCYVDGMMQGQMIERHDILERQILIS